jgi:hypothetical protein
MNDSLHVPPDTTTTVPPGLADLQAALEEIGAECRGTVCRCPFHDSTDFDARLFCERSEWVVACPVCGLPPMDVEFIRLFTLPLGKRCKHEK